MTKTSHPQSVLIIGGGFAGVRAARQLADNPAFRVLLMSSSPNFSYYPQLYHAATGGVRSEASLPLYDLFEGSSVEVVQDTAAVLDSSHKQVTGLSGAKYTYDYLILALGAVTNYFGIPGLAEFSFDIKTIEGAERFKRHLHDQLTRSHKPEHHYVVVGGGPTGIELAAGLSEYLQHIVKLHGVKAPKYAIELVEAAPRLLPRSPESHAVKIKQRLEALGVKVLTGATVQGETVDRLQLKGKSITTSTVVWTAGVSNNPFYHNNAESFTLAKNGRVEVDAFMEATPNVYVLGDNAATTYGGLAQTAIGDADFAAADLRRRVAGQPRKAYKQAVPTSVIPVGTGWAAVERGNLHLYGHAAWLLRRAADLIAYQDIEALPGAVNNWLKDGRQQNICRVCDAPSLA